MPSFVQNTMNRNFVHQTRFAGDPKGGNCVRAAVASFFGLELEQVPDFNAVDPAAQHDEIEAYFGSRGLYLLRLPANYVPEVDYLVSGNSPREGHHMVIMNDGKLVHDPHPSGLGLTKINHVYLVVPVRQDTPMVETALKSIGWQWRFYDAQTGWFDWAPVDARSRLSTIEDRVKELKQYIAQDYKYQIRELFALVNPQGNKLVTAKVWPEVNVDPQYENPAEGWEDPALPDFAKLREVARECGYALAIHGSLKRDVDLIAVPWEEGAKDPSDLVQALCEATGGHEVGTPTHKPFGRYATNIKTPGWTKLIDLSIIPPVKNT